MQLNLQVEVARIDVLRRAPVREEVNIKHQPPLEKLLVEQCWAVLGLDVLWDSDQRVADRDVLDAGIFLFNLDEFVLGDDEHVAEIAYSDGSR